MAGTELREPSGRPVRLGGDLSTRHDALGALKRSASHLERGGRWTLALTSYVDDWLDLMIALRMAGEAIPDAPPVEGDDACP